MDELTPSAKELIAAHKGLVRRLASDIRRRYRISTELEELEAAGYLGLMQAHQSFDGSRGISFVTFAYYRVQGAIIDNLRQLGLMRREYLLKARFDGAANEVLEAAAQTAPASSDRVATASWLGETLDGLATAFVLTESGPEVVSSDPTPEKQAENEELRQRLTAALEPLSEEERAVVDRYYFAGERMAEIADAMGVSTSWVSRVHRRVLEKLRPVVVGEAEG